MRAWALKGLFRLQDPQTPGDDITAELLRAMSEDADKTVRMAAISTIVRRCRATRCRATRCRALSRKQRESLGDPLG